MEHNSEKAQMESHSLDNDFFVVGIGASAGGLEAFNTLLKAIPENPGMAFVLVQHLSPDQESLLPELLQKVTDIPVVEITDELKVKPDHIYVIPSNRTLEASDGVLKLSQRRSNNHGHQNLSINTFFSSLAEAYQGNAIGVILSGTGSDGSAGLRAIKKGGGISLAQDLTSASYKDMPENAVNEGVVDFVLPPGEIPQKIRDITQSFPGVNGEGLKKSDHDVFRQILSLLHLEKDIDFKSYKQTTVHRRILRRVALTQCSSTNGYLQHLRKNKSELESLYQDLLIPVTRFFRDSHSFEKLGQALGRKLRNSPESWKKNNLRIWVAGCSSGEEAYGIAIKVEELMEQRSPEVPEVNFQIFATDVRESAIEKARMGIYPKKELKEVGLERLRKFFTKANGNYRVNKELRQRVVFATHNLSKDPPFGKMDVISCRNLLIYMEPSLQKKALTTFHYALNPHGLLILGKSETTAPAKELFNVVDKKAKLFSRRDGPAKVMPLEGLPVPDSKNINKNKDQTEAPSSGNYKTAVDEVLLQKYAPPGVVVNDALDIVDYRGKTGPYLEQTSGKPTQNLLKLARSGLAFELRNACFMASKNKETTVKHGIPVTEEGFNRYVTIEIIPLNHTQEPHYLVLFHDEPGETGTKTGEQQPSQKAGKKSVKEKRIRELEEELEQNRKDMRNITEMQEASNEELQSANEELRSGNEELQSLNEELESSKEELQSTNEELTVINEELVNTNEQLTEARNYAHAIVETISMPLVILDKDLSVRSSNAAFYKKFNALQDETEGVSFFKIGNGHWNSPEIRRLLDGLISENKSFVDYEFSANFNSIGERTVKINGNAVKSEPLNEKLILLAIEDITEKMTAAKKAEENQQRYHNLIHSSPTLIAILKGGDMVVEIVNEAMIEAWGMGNNVVGKQFFSILPELAEQGYDNILDNVYKTGEPYQDFEKPLYLKSTDSDMPGYYNLTFHPQQNSQQEIVGLSIMAQKVTTQAELHKYLKDSESQYRQITDLMPDKVFSADANGNLTFFNSKWLTYINARSKDVENIDWKELIAGKDLDAFKKGWERSIKTGKSLEMELRLLGSSGELHWHLCRVVPLKNRKGAVTKWIGTNTEIQRIKEEEERREEFLKLVSHELKTPVTSIKGYVQLLLDMLGENKEKSQPADSLKSSLVRVHQQINRLSRLITEILDLSRIDDNRLELQQEEFDLNRLVNDTVQDLRYANPSQPIEISEKFVCNILGDSERIQQVLINFINNAIKYSPANKKIDIDVYQPEKDKVAISVKDYGVGISKKDQSKIFKRFYQTGGNSNKLSYSGFGIGLYISTEIIKKHDGSIELKSEKGKGSEFTFYLPCL